MVNRARRWLAAVRPARVRRIAGDDGMSLATSLSWEAFVRVAMGEWLRQQAGRLFSHGKGESP